MQNGTDTGASFAVGWEERDWRPAAEADDFFPVSRRERRAAQGPYRAAVPARVARLPVTVPGEVEAEAAEAAAEIARFDAEVAHALTALSPESPGDGADELAPLAAVLLRTESASSSQIENVTAGAKALALASLEDETNVGGRAGGGVNAVLVAGNAEAMRTAIALSDEISTGSILAAHAALMGSVPSAEPGRLRTQQVWVGGRTSSPHRATFVPPHHDRLREGIDDLVAFCARTDVPPLTHAAVAHAQFETLHPFVDGNGRTGRTLVHAMLRHAGITRRVTVPVSAGLLTDTDGYFDALTAYRAGDLAPIVARFAAASFDAIANGRVLVADLVGIHDSWSGTVTARADAAVWQLLPTLLRQPAVTVRSVRRATGVSQPAALHAVETLVAAGVLVPATTGRRNRVWVAPEVTDALDVFAERAGRRSRRG